MFNNLIDVIKSEEFNAADDIYRFNKIKCIGRENVSSHNSWVVITSMLFMEQLEAAGLFNSPYFKKQKKFNVSEFKYKAIMAATFHDFDECLSGDVLFDLKYNDYNGEEIKENIDQYIDYKMRKFSIKNKDKVNASIDKTIVKALLLAKEDFIIKFIVKIGDWMSCIKFERAELFLGNKSFEAIVAKSENALNELIDEFIERAIRARAIDSDSKQQVIEYLTQYIDITKKQSII